MQRRLEALCAEYGLPSTAGAALIELLAALAEDAAPTTVHAPAEAVDVHVADSLAGLAVERLRDATTIADLGSGAGLPALVLAVALPDAVVHAVESGGRKAAFIEATAARMGVTNVRVVPKRAEEWSDGLARCDAVCARALAALPVLVEYAAPLLRVGGVLVAWKGAVPTEEAADGRAAAARLGLEPETMVPVTPFPGSTRRTLHVYSKVMETPQGYPRRAGMASKRPLTAKN